MPLEGVDRANAELDRMIREEWAKVSQAFGDVCMAVIVPECVAECPVDTGILQQSIPAVSHMETTPDECIAVIGAGGAASAYALRQHEDLTLHHPPMTRASGTRHSRDVAIAKYAGGGGFGGPGKAKYIEDPIMRNAPNIPAMVIARKGQI